MNSNNQVCRILGFCGSIQNPRIQLKIGAGNRFSARWRYLCWGPKYRPFVTDNVTFSKWPQYPIFKVNKKQSALYLIVKLRDNALRTSFLSFPLPVSSSGRLLAARLARPRIHRLGRFRERRFTISELNAQKNCGKLLSTFTKKTSVESQEIYDYVVKSPGYFL